MASVTIKGTTPGPCGCCASATYALYCRTLGGIASLCGMPEYGTPSSPPKLYRTQTVGGGSAACAYHGRTCTDPFKESDANEYSGAYSYDGATCRTNPNTAQQTVKQGHVSCGAYESTVVSAWTPGTGLFAFGIGVFSRTKTREQIVITPGCFASSDDNSFESSGTVFSELSDEDTEADAIARATAPGWSDWAPAPSGCGSAKSDRGDGFSFYYQQAEWKVVASHLVPSHLYHLTVSTYRQPTGGGPWELVSTDTSDQTSSPSGTLDTTPAAVPFVTGYRYQISADITLVPA